MPVEFKHATLSNALDVVAEVDPAAHSAALGFFVRAGARDETPSLMGVSHFLEHMMFKGAEDLSGDELNRSLDALGARHNAYTTNELTCFYAQVLPDRMEEALSLVARMMRPALRQADFDTEKSVILEEIAMYLDNPFWVVYEACVDRHYAPHALSHRVLGTRETITALSRDAMRGYFDRWYSPGNTTLALAGRVDFDRAVDVARRHCEAWPATDARRAAPPPRAGGGFLRLRDEKTARAYAMGLAPAPSAGDDRRYAAMLLAQVLGAPENSRLHWALVEPGLADEAQASFDPHQDTGEFSLFVSADPDRIDEAWALAMREVDRLVPSLEERDLRRLRARLATAVTLGGERPSDRMQRLGRLWTLQRRYSTLEDELDRIARVTLDDLRGVARDFPPRPSTFVRLSPR